MPDLKTCVNIDEIAAAARRYLPGFLYDFIEGGVDAEGGLLRNRTAFDGWELLPRYLRDVSQRSTKTQLFGQSFSMPYGIAPTGPAQIFRRDADRMLARAARKANVPFILSGAAGASLEEVATLAPEHAWFQLYPARDRTITFDQIRRSQDAGLKALVVTIDTPVTPKRERHLRNQISVPFRPTLSRYPRIAREIVTHPQWFARFLCQGGIEKMGNWSPYAPAGADTAEVAGFFFDQAFVPGESGTLALRDLEQYRRLWKGPLIVKGVLHPEDALLALKAGADAIYVSNHGGKSLDCAPATITQIAAIRAAIGPDVPLLADSGFRRGSDVIKALCLGADFVFGGRPTLYGVAAGAQKGADRALEILAQEIDLVMAGIGCNSIAELSTDLVRKAQ